MRYNALNERDLKVGDEAARSESFYYADPNIGDALEVSISAVVSRVDDGRPSFSIVRTEQTSFSGAAAVRITERRVGELDLTTFAAGQELRWQEEHQRATRPPLGMHRVEPSGTTPA